MFRIALILGLLSAVGPFAIDMYLPAMPQITDDLATTAGGTQQTLTAFFLAFGLAQLVYGPWADQAGRKLPIYTGLTIFVLATVGCALAPTIELLVAFRFLQGLGGSVVMVVPRAVIRDMHTGPQATKLMAMVMLVISISPMLAPLAGSAVTAVAGWRGIFGVLGLAALISLILTATALRETLPPERRVRVNLRSLLRGTRTLLTDPTFMGLTFIGGFGMASFFAFLASASFVYVDQFGLTPTGFSLAFAVNAVGFFSASQLAGPLGERMGTARVIRLGITGFVLFATATLALVAAGYGSLPVLIAGLLLGNAGLGLVIPTTMVMALDPHGEIAGLASSLGGTLQMLAGGIMIAVSGLFFDGTALPMMAVIAGCAWAAGLLTLAVLPRLSRQVA
ncbi:multidrug effflux MFS transporter [Psychromarinibacter sp. C21-152]|uniref:Bcr/CflA family efflux transporter n=1 Tax=Psychromarinibacter sediminicola TaxID=3033385 RepID=A0AAE3TBB2_9RHOB|nr:multidrug effflux MFS transporter [Psychromarinibacter sediminicola]MDF0602500.1 multidrug effflux MFS transporter [Psychromarinibacter sediminicola]